MTTDSLKTKRSSIQKETNQSQADQEENVEIQICLIFWWHIDRLYRLPIHACLHVIIE